MKKRLVQVTAILAFSVLFSCKGNENQSQSSSTDSLTTVPADSTKAKAAYVCPMHPMETSDKPAKCPICGMDLEAKS